MTNRFLQNQLHDKDTILFSFLRNIITGHTSRYRGKVWKMQPKELQLSEKSLSIIKGQEHPPK
jgi:hypothetical protein